jgi:hypothetical protein
MAAVCALIAALLLPASQLEAAPRCFPEAAPAIVDCIDGRLRTFWEQQGGLAVFGYPLSAAAPDQSRPGAPLAQRFERTRLELHPEQAQPYDVLLGRMGAEALAQRGIDWTTLPNADPSAPHYVAETGHAIAPQFWGYWSAHGLEFDSRPGASYAESLALFGFPLTEPQLEQSPTDGQRYLTQWFERARFEYHPEHAGTPYEVELGLLGREAAAAPADPAPTPAPAPTLPPGGFIQVAGGQLTRLGQPIQLKGVNYYPQGRPWKDMWNAWDGPQIERELRQARDDLGINAVRVLLPYDLDENDKGGGQLTPELLGRVRELAQIAGSLDLRLIVALFDFADEFPAPGSREEQRQLDYLGALIGNFVGDDRIIAWDVHNEPDNYDTWKHGNSAAVLTWLGRMADEIHRLAPNHLVTVGMGYYQNLLLAGPDGRRPIDYSDFISVHSYNSGDIGRQLDELRGYTAKPLILGEFGWPTGITCLNRSYTEAEQTAMYRATLAAIQGKAAGVLAWSLRDHHPGLSRRWDSREEYYGLYRIDNTLKPAGQELRAFSTVALLPSALRTNLPLTTSGGYPWDGGDAPLLIPATGHYVKSRFRQAWDLLGGQTSFGAPITEAFTIPGDKPNTFRVLQYFEAGALELKGQSSDIPDFAKLPEQEQIKLLVQPLDVGVAYAAGRIPTGQHDVAPPFQSFYRGAFGTWRLGAALTDAFVEDLGGVRTTVQYFEKGRLQLNPATQTVELGALGSWAWQQRCASAP